MGVVGFDIGNENCVIAVARQHGIDIVLNDESERETPAAVLFAEKQRFIGSAAATSAPKNPQSTISQIKRLICLNFSAPGVQTDLHLMPFSTTQAFDGRILVHLEYLGEAHTFTPVQLMAMLFSHLKQLVEKNLGTLVSDCVMGVPAYLTDLQRRAYMNAALIAGLRPIRLLHDCTATALGYGIYKTDFPSSGVANVVFVDIGHCDTQVSVVAFRPDHMKVLSHAFDGSLGGRDFDEVLFNHFAIQFKQEYDIDVYSNVRACVRLRAACEKVKKVLSANAGAPINIECLMEEKDVKGFITRDEFEKLSMSVLERIIEPCKKSLADAGLEVHRIHCVELVGSGSRIPAITRMLAHFFEREPSRTVNASECVARGCALQCAMLSPVFRVKDYEVQDCFPYSVGFSVDGGPAHKMTDNILFPKGHHVPSVKMLTLYRTNIFHLETFYTDPRQLPPGTPPGISSFTIGPFHASLGGNFKIKVAVHLNLHGIVTVDSASLIEGEADGSVRHSDGMHAESFSESEVSGMKNERSRRTEITVVETIFGGMSKADVLEALEKETQLAHQDTRMEQTKDRRNALEAYIYETRNKILDAYRAFCSDAERGEICRRLQETEDWLYEEGNDETEDIYSCKLEGLEKLVGPVHNRFKDEAARHEAVRNLLKCITDYRISAKLVPDSSSDEILNACNRAEQWLRESMQTQDSVPTCTDPAVWSEEIRRRMKDLDETCRQLMKLRSPKQKSEAGGSSNTDMEVG